MIVYISNSMSSFLMEKKKIKQCCLKLNNSCKHSTGEASAEIILEKILPF